MRKIHAVNESVKVYRDSEWDEYVVKKDGKAVYHSDDKEDAISTAAIIAASEITDSVDSGKAL